MRMIEMRIGQEPLLQVGEVSWQNFRGVGNHKYEKIAVNSWKIHSHLSFGEDVVLATD